jgi:hypothetical protein
VSADEYRRIIQDALEAGDWHEAYRWAKGWIGSGGGARSVEPWLVYMASSLLRGQPRGAVNSADLALKHWIRAKKARAVIRYARGEVIRLHLRDPKTALDDLRASCAAAPPWLRELSAAAMAACEQEAPASRKRKPSVGPAPDYARPWMPAPSGAGSVREPPPLWDTTHPIITTPRA